MPSWRLFFHGLILSVLLSVSPCVAATSHGALLGKPVQEVLEDLRGDSLPLVYSTGLVSRTLRVLEEPAATEPVQIVSEVLAPHGLTLRELDGVHYVVRHARSPSKVVPGSILAVVKQQSSGQYLPGAQVQLVDAGGRTLPLPNGATQFSGLTPGTYSVMAEAPLYEPQRRQVDVDPGRTAVAVFELDIAHTELSKITVTASRYSLINDLQSSLAYFSREQVENLPDLGNDPLRTAQRLPGTAAGGVSAKTHIRGGEENEVLLVFDGLELFDPFHARDYQNVFSIVDQRALSGIEVYTGGFPVPFGDRLSGVMLLEPLEPDGKPRHELGISVFNTSLLTNGMFADGRGDWLISARRSNLDLVLNEDLGEPNYNDVLGHIGLEVGDTHELSVNGLISNDDILVVTESDPDELEFGTSKTRNAQFWLKWEAGWTTRLTSTTLISSSQFDNDRRGEVTDPEKTIGFVDDMREVDVLGFKQDWQLILSDVHLAKWGVQFKRLDASYDYFSSVEFFGLFEAFEISPGGERESMVSPDGESYSVYFSDRFRFGMLIAELGARWDRQTYLDSGPDNQLSPRVNLLYRLTPATDVRLSWGRFFQSQGIQELQVEDGVTNFFPAQRADHTILSLEHRFPSNNLALRIEAFRKSMGSLRPRFENLWTPLALLPELEPDRVMISPSSALAQGIEISLASKDNGSLDWWASYSLARVEDTVDGMDVPRSWDQRHAISGGVNWETQKWNLSAGITYRTGWPTTDLSAVADQETGDVLVDLGPRNGARLGDFFTVDFRASRSVPLAVGELSFFVEVSNLFNRDNPCCIDQDLEQGPDGLLFLDRAEEYWLPLLPAVGVLWEF